MSARARSSLVSRSPLALLAVVALGLAACAPAYVPPPAPEEGAGTAVRTATYCFVLANECTAPKMIFARLENPDDLQSGKMLFATVSVVDGETGGRRYYLLNAKPGTYVPVGVGHMQKQQSLLGFGPPVWGRRYYLYSKEIMESAKVTVKPGSFLVMGDLDTTAFTGSDRMDKADPAQTHYMSKIREANAQTLQATNGAMDEFLAAKLVTNKKDAESDAKLRKLATDDLGQAWAGMIAAKP